MADDPEAVASQSTAPDSPYKRLAPRAYLVKARLQMAIGVVAVVFILGHLLWQAIALWSDNTALDLQRGVLNTIGFALVLAAAIELAYTLFTPGPDEALDPLMLGLSATLLLQLGRADQLDYHQGIAVVLYVVSLAALFAVRKFLTSGHEPNDWTPPVAGRFGGTWNWLKERNNKRRKSARTDGATGAGSSRTVAVAPESPFDQGD